jgi:hypothetical protein
VVVFAMLRLYFNIRGSLPWSIDEGDPSSERMFSTVELRDITGRAVFDRETTGQPCAWIAFENAGLKVEGSHALLYAKL